MKVSIFSYDIIYFRIEIFMYKLFVFKHLGSKFTLTMPFIDNIFSNQVVNNLTLKIILPEMVSDIKFSPPYDVYEKHSEIMKTYLDTSGRPVIVAKVGNLVGEHIQDFVVGI